MLDKAGFPYCKIIASNSLDEYIIRDLSRQGACVDAFGVGERLITSKTSPVFGGVYKLAAIEDDAGNIIPKIKVSENISKITIPHFKKVYRLYSNTTGKAEADLITVYDEVVDTSKPLEIFDPDYTWKRKTLTDITAYPLLKPIFKGGVCVYKKPSLDEIRDHCRAEISSLWDEVLRFENPHNYYVDLSQRLWDVRRRLLDEHAYPKSSGQN
jgi:nicotinate phosphoribosyltransferase